MLLFSYWIWTFILTILSELTYIICTCIVLIFLMSLNEVEYHIGYKTDPKDRNFKKFNYDIILYYFVFVAIWFCDWVIPYFRYSRYDVANLVVYLGAHNIKTDEVRRTSHKVIRLIKHKGFDQGTLVNIIIIYIVNGILIPIVLGIFIEYNTFKTTFKIYTTEQKYSNEVFLFIYHVF